MRKAYTMLLALGVAAASLTSCSKSTYSFNAAPAYLGSQPVAVAKAAPVAPAAEATEVAVAPATNVTKPEPTVVATTPAPAAKAAPVAAAEVAPATEAATLATVTPAAKAAKPSLVQRIMANKIAKQLAKAPGMKQVAAGIEKTQSLKKTGLFLALGGLLALIIGLVIVGGSGLSGSGGGVVFGAILFYLGFVALVTGVILSIVGLIIDK